MSLKTPENKAFVSDFMAWLKTGPPGVQTKNRVTCSPMNLSRIGVYLWKQAVEKAGTFDVDKVRDALIGQTFKGPTRVVTMQANHHLINNFVIGETLATRHFKSIKSLPRVARA